MSERDFKAGYAARMGLGPDARFTRDAMVREYIGASSLTYAGNVTPDMGCNPTVLPPQAACPGGAPAKIGSNFCTDPKKNL
jgi:hypothetical protein